MMAGMLYLQVTGGAHVRRTTAERQSAQLGGSAPHPALSPEYRGEGNNAHPARACAASSAAFRTTDLARIGAHPKLKLVLTITPQPVFRSKASIKRW